MALSQFITYLLILIVGEKENKIKEGMKIMGLKDSVFWLSWFIIYGIFVLFLSIVCCVLLFTLQVFQNTNFLLIFLLVLFYTLSIIMFGFMITPFFDKSRVSTVTTSLHLFIIFLTDCRNSGQFRCQYHESLLFYTSFCRSFKFRSTLDCFINKFIRFCISYG